MLQQKYADEIATLLSRYDRKQSAVLPLLYLAQDEYGYLTRDAIREVATILEMPYTDVFEVVGFYTLLYERPVGKWVLQVCDDVPCCYLGAEELVAGLKQRLGIVENQTTPDGMFTLQRVKCLAACDKAPLLQANLDFIYHATPETLDGMLQALRARAASDEPLSVSGRQSEDYDAVPGGAPRLIVRELGQVPLPGPVPDESARVAAQEAASAPAEPARAEAEARAAAGAIPAHPAQQETPRPETPTPSDQPSDGSGGHREADE